MAVFQVDPNWEQFHTDLAKKTIAACEELSEIYLPKSVYEIKKTSKSAGGTLKSLEKLLEQPKTPSTANTKVRNYLVANYKNCFFLHIISEAAKGAEAVSDWLVTCACSAPNFENTRVEFQRIADEQALRQRTLFEALLSAISFSTIAGNIVDCYIEHYVACHTYVNLRKIRNEYFAAFDVAALNVTVPVEEELDAVGQKILQIEADSNFDLNLCWYLQRPKLGYSKFTFVPGTTYPSLPNDLLDAAGRLNYVLKQNQQAGLDMLEKAALGFTYQTLYGSTSQQIHFSPDLRSKYFLTSPQFQRSLTSTNILSASLVCRALLMTSLPNPQTSPAQALFDMIAGASTQPMFESVVGKPQAMIGDYLVAQMPTGTIVGEVESLSIHATTNYVLYKVKPFYFGVNPAPCATAVRSSEVVAIFTKGRVQQIATEFRTRAPLGPMSTQLTFLFGIGKNMTLLEEIAESLGGIEYGAAKMRFMVSV